MKGQKPVFKHKVGQVSASLFENNITTKTGDKTTMVQATIERSYKNKDGIWQSTNSFNRTEIPIAIFCLQKALEKIYEPKNILDQPVEEVVI